MKLIIFITTTIIAVLILTISVVLNIIPLNFSSKQIETQKAGLTTQRPTVKINDPGFDILCPFDNPVICKEVKISTIGENRLNAAIYNNVPYKTPIIAGVDGEYVLSLETIDKSKLPGGESNVIMVRDGFRLAIVLYFFEGKPAKMLVDGPKKFSAGDTIGYVGKDLRLTILEMSSTTNSFKLMPSDGGKILKPLNN